MVMAPGSTRRPRCSSGPWRQEVPLEHLVDRLEVELGRQVEHGEVLVVEVLDGPGPVPVAGGQIVEEGQVLVDVVPDVHAHEAAQLQEARVDPASARPGSATARW